MRKWTSLLVLLLTLIGSSSAPAGGQGLTVDRTGTLQKDGKPFRGIGVNYFDAFARTLANPRDTGYEAGFQTLEEARIPFCRIMAGGYWPTEQRLYLDDKQEFFRRFDAVLRSARRHRIGLILSCFWYLATVPDTVGEPVSAWGDPKSRTQTYMRHYVRDLVKHCGADPAVWGWEFGNEYCLAADLPNAVEHRPAIAPSLGTPSVRTAKDEIGYAALHAAYASFAMEVRKYDRYRIVETGDSMPRDSAWHNWKEHTWAPDSAVLQAALLDEVNPQPIDVVSVHFYKESSKQLRAIAEYARHRRKPLFIGEFGAEGAGDRSRAAFDDRLQAVLDSGAPFAALWVFDFAGQEAIWNVTASNERAYQLRAISAANDTIRSGR
ncbi:MAG TPA: cellulase family glycosylhydrolase [Chthonomonadaceae bacterium]|nr:cellulase family glycosylhydrolase [Chthonomonadaceae bacterium]